MCVLCPFYTPSFLIKGLVGTFPDVWLPIIATNEKVGSVSFTFIPHEKIYPENQVNIGKLFNIRFTKLNVSSQWNK